MAEELHSGDWWWKAIHPHCLAQKVSPARGLVCFNLGHPVSFGGEHSHSMQALETASFTQPSIKPPICAGLCTCARAKQSHQELLVFRDVRKSKQSLRKLCREPD